MKKTFTKQEILNTKIGSIPDLAIEALSFINNPSFSLSNLLGSDLAFKAKLTIPFYCCELTESEKETVIGQIESINGVSINGTWQERLHNQIVQDFSENVQSQILSYLNSL
jgi:hypothetical protein